MIVGFFRVNFGAWPFARRRTRTENLALTMLARRDDRRDRQRILALQTPRLTVTPACPGGQTGTSRAALRRTRGGRSAPRGALLFATGTTPTPERGHDWTPIQGQTSTPIDRHWDQHGELAEVLGGGGEVEFVAGAVWAA
jgi:hypothetical protein